MMRPVVHTLHSPDAEPDEYAPADAADATIFIQAMVGVADEEGEDVFNLEVYTPAALAERLRESGPRIGRHTVIVERWDFPRIEAFLTHAFESRQAATWTELAPELGRIGRWEFEDYDEARDSWAVPPGVGAVVRSLRAGDVDLASFTPPDRTDFRVPVTVTVGTGAGEGEGTFTTEVCTPTALERRVRTEGPIIGEHLLIVERWDPAAIAAALTRAFESVDGADWAELAGRLSRFGAPADR